MDGGGAGEAARDGSAWLALNRAAWEERVPLHVASSFYDNDTFVAGRSSLEPFEVDEMGPVAGKRLVHLQCHFGQDTLSWARLGAEVTGLDFTESGVLAARELAARCGVVADFVCADVYDAVEALGGRRFDIVYTGLGALVWLPDIVRWADVVATLLEPGGCLYLSEFHPFTDVFADDALVAVRDYFTRPAGDWSDSPGTYVDWEAPTVHNETVEWTHPIGSVVSALIDAGLRIELLHEHDYTLFERWPFLVRRDEHTFELPAGAPRLPLMYSLRARRPVPGEVGGAPS